MPNFDQVSVAEAMRSSATGKRAKIIREYSGYLDGLRGGQAGRLRPSAGETVAAVRRRLGQAAKLADKSVVIKRVGEDVYFWEKPAGGAAPQRRGRPRKNASAS